jgi:rod shape-determining protein MreB
MPRAVVLATSEVSGAIRDLVRVIVAAAVECIVTAPPDLANDLLSRGLYLAGGGALLDGLAKRLATAAAIPVHLSDMPTRAAVLGAARCLRALDEPAERSQVVASGAVRAADADEPSDAG